MGMLAPEKLKERRRGWVPYLERVINCNLSPATGTAGTAANLREGRYGARVPCWRSAPSSRRRCLGLIRSVMQTLEEQQRP